MMLDQSDSRQLVGKAIEKGPAFIAKKAAMIAEFCLLHPKVFVDYLAFVHRYFSRQIKQNIKIFNECYAKYLTTSQRARLRMFNWKILEQVFSRKFVKGLLRAPIVLWETDRSGTSLAAELQPARHDEGELNVVLSVNKIRVYTVTFLIAPGNVSRSRGPVVFVTRMQGIRGVKPEIRLAAKLMLGVAPPLVLMSILDGFATRVGAVGIVGVSVANQMCSRVGDLNQTQLLQAYDEFWISLDGQHLDSGDYYFQVPMREKELSLVKSNHRRRASARQALRREIARAVTL